MSFFKIYFYLTLRLVPLKFSSADLLNKIVYNGKGVIL